MKTINWKGNISAVIIVLFVAASYFFVHKDEAMPSDANYITAKADMSSEDNSIAITADDISSDDSSVKDKPEVVVGDPFQKVLKVLGEPDNKTVTKDKYGTCELWTYNAEGKSIFIVNGWVDSITESN